MAKTAQELLNQNNVNKGITTGLDSEATVKPQPSKDFNSWSNKTDGANPESPSTNNATRREKYGISQGTTVPESTKIGAYDTVSPVVSTDRWTTPDSDSWNQYTWYIKKIKGNSFITTEYDKLRKEIEDSLRAKGIDTTKEVYGDMITDYVNKAIQAEYDMWALSAQMSGLTDTQAYNVKLVDTLVKETWAALAQGKSVKEIAQALGQDERVIQKIAQGKHAELIQLSQEYEDEQMRKYIRYKEDLDTQIARNITQYQNAKTNLDYQFNSAMSTLKNSLFDAEWTARGTAAWLWMTWTSYLLDRIQNQYNNQMMDLQNTYEYQSANAQIAINNALEDYTTNVKRYMEDYSTAIKEIQSYVYDNYLRLSNQMLSAADQLKALSQVKANVEEMKANAIVSAAAALEDWNTSLYNYIRNAYGLEDLTVHQFTDSELNRSNFDNTGQATNSLWNILNSNDWIRIGTYTRIVDWKPYTYNVYATREDWIRAAKQLLHSSRYRGKTMKQIAQTWTWNSNPSTAWKVIEEEWLKLTDTLSEDNIDKLLVAIWRWEWTMRKWQTLEERASEWQDLSSYAPTVGTTSEWLDTYTEWYEEDYKNFLANWTDWFKKASQDILTKKFGSWSNFVANAKAYQKVMTAENAETIMDSLASFQELQDTWNSIWPAAQTMLKTEAWQWIWNFWSSSMIKARLSKKGIWANEAWAISHFMALFNNIRAKWFIDTLINSKTKWAAYGQLSDAEWAKITDAWSALSLKDPLNFSNTIQKDFINPLTKKLREWWYTDDQISEYISSINLNPQQNSSVFSTQWRYGSWTQINPIPWQ